MTSLKGVANNLRETLRTFAYFDRTREINALVEQQAQSPNKALENLISRVRTTPVKVHDKVRIVEAHIEIRPYGSADDLDNNRYANWVTYNELAGKLRAAGYVAQNTQRGYITVYDREDHPVLPD